MPPTPEFCVGDTNMLVYFGVTPDANPKICVTPDANPRRQSVEYRWRWAFWHWGWRWACQFHVVYVNFICVGHPRQTRFSVEYGLKLYIRQNYSVSPRFAIDILDLIEYYSTSTVFLFHLIRPYLFQWIVF